MLLTHDSHKPFSLQQLQGLENDLIESRSRIFSTYVQFFTRTKPPTIQHYLTNPEKIAQYIAWVQAKVGMLHVYDDFDEVIKRCTKYKIHPFIGMLFFFHTTISLSRYESNQEFKTHISTTLKDLLGVLEKDGGAT